MTVRKPGAELIVRPDGSVRMIYDEAVDPRVLGSPTIRRGSYVEPMADGRWTADLSPVGGPVFGPLETRSQALKAEVSWLRRHWLIPAGS